jgi:hypothetical protein
MKTIEKEAQEYAIFWMREYLSTNPGWHDISLRDGFEEPMRNAFSAGIALAEEWISVDNELPEIEEYVFIKWRNGYIFRAKLIMVNAEGGEVMRWVDQRDRFADIESPVTHWRYIELKSEWGKE